MPGASESHGPGPPGLQSGRLQRPRFAVSEAPQVGSVSYLAAYYNRMPMSRLSHESPGRPGAEADLLYLWIRFQFAMQACS